MAAYLDGTDLILGIMVAGGTTQAPTSTFTPLGHSTTCKISDSTETGERQHKEASQGKFKDKYVKSLSETITAEGFIYDTDALGLPQLKVLWLKGETVKARYCQRGAETTTYYEGDFVITQLEQDGPAGDDQKWSLTLENAGPITPKPAG